MDKRSLAVIFCVTFVLSLDSVQSRAGRQKRDFDPFGGGGGDPFGGGGDPFGGGATGDPFAGGGGTTDKCKPIQAPANAQVNCVTASDSSPFYHCISTADPGYQFRDGDKSKQKDCDSMTGNFFGGNQFENVVAICDPPCQHHGVCVMPDTCACTSGWKGAKCDQAAALCEDPKSPQGGSIQCHQGTSKKECTVTCQPGFRFEYQPSDKYTCSADGTWTPPKTTMPNCIPVGSGQITPGGNTQGPQRTRDAMCAAWGQDHYRTFDGTVYSFQGRCEYLLAKDSKSGTFHVHIINDKKCTHGTPCKREIDVYMGQTKVNFRKEATGPVVYINKFPLTIPTSRDGTTFERLGRYIIMKSSLGFMIRWDGRESVFMSVSADHKNAISGLCGTYNGNKADDMTTDTGKVVTSASSFASTWKKSDIGADVCPDTPQKTCDGTAASQADSVCNKIMDPAFKACHAKVDPADYKESCKSDCCNGDLGKCSCSSLEAYARACMEAGVILNWRSDQLCAVSCPYNLVHRECGSPCQKTCTSVGSTCQDTSCVDGCFCPHGMVLHEKKCIMADQCPCTKEDGTEYQAGQVIPKDCNKCTCMAGGRWQCTQNKCQATCSATGDPHYMTFDGKRFNFMGICQYYMMKDDKFNIAVENIKCGHGQASCTKSVSIDFGGHIIKLDHNHQLFYDNQEIHKLPFHGEGVKIYMVSSLFMKAELANGITLLWDGRTRAYITAPSSFFNKTMGLCGTYDSNQKNDFKTKEGDIETDINSFGNRMRVNPQCAPMKPGQPTDACEANAQRKPQAAKYCAYMNADFFKPCHSVVDPTTFHEDCMYDMCACSENIRDCLCPMIGEYAKQCAAGGIEIKWRNHIPECQIPCNGGQVYQVCPNECVRTCSNIALDPNCVQSKDCAEGCGCPANQTLNDEGECIKIKDCPCTFGGNEYPAGFLTKMEDKICTCRNANWECTVIPTVSAVTVTITGNGTVPPQPKVTQSPWLDHIRGICEDKPNSQFVKCMSECPVTCKNMRGSTPTCQAPSKCSEGCECKPGYVLEGKQCILPTSCPCYHGGHAYFEGEKIQSDCNECTCRGQNWACTTKECPAICSAVGDSHYHTYDGRDYDFQGNCDYVLSKSTDNNPNKFLITEENVPCGSSGVTCTKSISFSIGEPGTKGFYRIQLIKGKPISVESGSPFNVTEVGESIMVTTPSGITLVWDKGTRVYIKLRTEHKGKVEGLCGNFDGDQNNDFTMPNGGPPAIKATKFGDSWKVHEYCATPNNITDTCEKSPQRKPWAQGKCAIISSKVFESCHLVIPYQKYLDKCVFDACACDLGGDCECLCTAVAAYAHECAIAGVPIIWRTEQFCPIQCEQCQKYNPCISICPKRTCDNRLVYDQTIKDCKEEMCFEGCDTEQCAPGMVYDGKQTPMKCIPEPFCNTTACVINGKNYRQNEPINDKTICDETCEICFCDKGEVKRNGFCSTTLPPSTISPAIIKNETPTPSPTADNKTPPPSPLGVSGKTPTPSPTADNKTPPPSPLGVSGKTPTPSPTADNKTPTPSPSGVSGKTPTPSPTGDNKTPTPSPSGVSGKTPTPSPTADNKTPTPSPSGVSGKTPTPSPLGVSGKTPTPSPTGDNKTPTPSPSGSSGKTPTPSPTADNKTPTPSPSGVSGKTPTPSPTADNKTPTPSPTPVGGSQPAKVTTMAIKCLKDGWTDWMSAAHPTPTNQGDIETISGLRKKYVFCDDHMLTAIQCRIIGTNVMSADSGQKVSCDLKEGLKCLKTNQDNGQDCNDYEVRLECDCGLTQATTPVPTPGTNGSPTPSPSSVSGGQPTPSPSSVSGGQPTPSPSSVSGGQPTPGPTPGPNGSPTPGPSAGPDASPTPSPTGISGGTPPTKNPLNGDGPSTISPTPGPNGSPTPSPSSVSGGQPTPSPSSVSGGQPTPSPSSVSGGQPTPSPSSVSGGQPTPGPTPGPNGSPTPGPSAGPDASPTPSPTGISGGTPPTKNPLNGDGPSTISPTPGPNGSPTPSPSSVSGGQPTPSPSSVSGGQPTPGPTPGPNGSPTPGPSAGPDASPTPSPTGISGGTPPTKNPLNGDGPSTISPTPGPNGSPTPSPSSVSGGQPTPSPSSVSGGQPTPSPSSVSGGQPTPSPSSVSGGQPTPGPTPGPNGSPTPGPSAGPDASPTPSPTGISGGTPPTKNPLNGDGPSTISPTPGPNGSPTPSPSSVSGGQPTPSPSSVSGGQPTPGPTPGPNGSPTPGPSAGPDASPTPSPTGISGGTPPTKNPLNGDGPSTISPTPGPNGSPTPSPASVSGGQPTPSPSSVSGGQPTPGPTPGPHINPTRIPLPTYSETPLPYTCKDGWSNWMNVDSPNVKHAFEIKGSGDYELMGELRHHYSFCAKPTAIKCQTVMDKRPYTSSKDDMVTCDLIDGLVCSNSNQGGGSTCSDYEVSVYCDCADATLPPGFSTPEPGMTTTPGQGIPYPPTPSCMWTPWMNSHTKLPGTKGEYETISNLRLHYSFCAQPAKIECRDMASKQSYKTVNQQGVSCDVNRGLVCEDINQNNANGQCLDYEVRVYCVDACLSTASPTPGPNDTPTPSPGSDGQGSPTPSPSSVSGEVPTPSPTGVSEKQPTPSPTTVAPTADVCVEGWTDWINTNNPAGKMGDIEQPKDIPGYPKTCDEVIAARCAVQSSGMEYKTTGQNVNCNVKGLTCVSDQTQTCLDYKAKFYCACKKPTPQPTIPPFGKPTPHPGSDQQVMSTLTATPSAGTIICNHGWTQEMNVDTPNDGDNGDYETIPKLRKKYAFCDDGNIIAARCYKAGTNITSDRTGERVTCDHTKGLTCNNWDQLNQSAGKCSDYSIRFYCNCRYTTATIVTATNKMITGLNTDQPTPSKDSTGPTKAPTKTPPTTHVSAPMKVTTSTITTKETPIPFDHCKTEIGIKDGAKYSYEMFSASSSKGAATDAYNARLNGPKAWEARYPDVTSEYIQIDLGEPIHVAGIRIQGNPSKDMYVTRFSIATSLDGQHWTVYQKAATGSDAVYHGNSDRNTPVDVMLDGNKGDKHILTHYVRILPRDFVGGISLRFEVLSCKMPVTPPTGTTIEVTPYTGPPQLMPTARPLCYEPMGIENSLRVKDSQLKSSSSRDKMTGAQYGRLLNEFGSWIPKVNDTKPWIIVDLKQPKVISGIMTQGSAKEEKWITKYMISYSMDGFTYTSFSPRGKPMMFEGNHDKNTIVKHVLPSGITARFIKIHPITGGPNGMGLRFNLLGCFYFIPGLHHHTTSITGTGTVTTISPQVPSGETPTPSPTPFPTLEPLCKIKMGVENSLIVGKSQLTGSSSKDSHTGPNNGRLNEQEKKPTAWVPSPLDKNPYIQVNFLEPKTITGVMIQGHGSRPQWTKTFTVFTSIDGKTFTPYSDKKGDSNPKIFPGNKNNTQPETYLFNRKIVAQYVRIYPKQYTGAPAIRFNLLGCNPSAAVTTPAPTLPPGVTTVAPSVPPQGIPTPKPGADQYIAPPKVCLTTMGLQSSSIVDDKQITASSSQKTSSPQAGRIYGEESWTPSKTDTKPWIQVDFLRPKLLSGVVTQGAGKSSNWVKAYQIFTSLDGINFRPYSDKPGDTTPKTYTGNNDTVTPVRHLFNRNITAQFIRLYPVDSHTGTPTLRWNVIGCNPDTPKPLIDSQATPTPSPEVDGQYSPTPQPGSDKQGVPTFSHHTQSTLEPSAQSTGTPTPAPLCEIPMGLSNKMIVTDSQLTASSKLNEFSGANRGRIYMEKDGSFTGGWIPSVSNNKQWIQVDLLAPYEITGIVTQGQSEKPQWVTKYEVYYSTDGEHFIPVPKSPFDKSPMVFTGNKDQFTPLQHLFPKVTGRFIRVHPLEWHSAIGLRFNILGCQSPSPKPHLTTTTPMVDSTATHTPGPLSCMYWTPWVSTSTPDKIGEYETIFNLDQLVHSCDKTNMKAIECRDMATKKSHDQIGETGVSCDLKTVGGLLCRNEAQSDKQCNDYEIRVFCDECPYTTTVAHNPDRTKIPTPSPTDSNLATPTPSPRPCENRTFWSNWLNNHKPDNTVGESEFMDHQAMNKFCPFGKVNKIECTMIDGTDYTADMNMVTCTLSEGFNCDIMLNAGFPCSDYRVRYQCEEVCLATPTPKTTEKSTPKVTEKPTPVETTSKTTGAPTPITTDSPPQRCVVSKWSPWINRDKPDVGGSDHEQMTPEEKKRFCYGGNVTKIECAVNSENHIPYYSSGELVRYCDKEKGIMCSNADNYPVTCSDYKVRYYCECSNQTGPTKTPTPHTTDAPTPGKTSYPRCAWSDWLSGSTPTDSPTGGDMETMESLRKQFGLCPNIVDIECRIRDNGSVTSATQNSVTCDIHNGLRCYNRDQVSFKCHDYEVKVKCWDDSCNPTLSSTASPKPQPNMKTTQRQPDTTTVFTFSETTTSICAPGEILEPCAFKCGDLCDNMAQLVDTCKQTTDTCVPLCRPAKHTCAPGEKLKDKITCVQQSMCPCRKQDGTIAKPLEKWNNPNDYCSVCHCFNNTVTCTKDDSCSTPSPTPYQQLTVRHPQCFWTYWINMDTPLTSEGDIETISKIRQIHTFCDNPVQIECREVKSQADASTRGQTVTCDLNTGFKCLNFQNGGKCDDYEVRFYCPCATTPTTTTTSTVAPPSDMQLIPTAAPHCGWSNWINRDNPTIMKEGKPFEGDHESIASLRKGHYLCDYYMMTKVECRAAETKMASSATGEVVSCDRIRGLRCKNDAQPDGKCQDYEIRVFCDCYGIPGLHHHTTPPTTVATTTTTTQGPIPHVCAWTTWLNGHTPDNLGEMETFNNLKKQYRFCDVEEITGIECRQHGTGKSSMEAGQQGILCDVAHGGLLCSNDKQMATGGKCFDYEVRVLCEPKDLDCSQLHVTTVAPSPGEFKNPTPAPTADVFGNPILHPTPEPQGSPTPSPQTDEFGNPVRHTTFKIPTKDTTTRISAPAKHTTGVVVETTTEKTLLVCTDGMTTGSALPMQNDQMSVSSSMTPNSGPQRSHLTDTNQGSSTGGWVAGKNEKGEWIMINFAKPMIIDGITTKGQAGQPYWIKAFRLLYSMDLKTFTYYEENGQPKTFSANFDSETPVHQQFTSPINAKYLRLLPIAWNGAIALRWQLFGCTAAPRVTPPLMGTTVAPTPDVNGSPTPSPTGDNGKSPTPSPHGDNFNSPTPSPHGDNGQSPTPSPHGDNGQSPTPSPHGDNGQSPTPSPHGDNGKSPTPSPNGSNFNSPTPSPTGDNGKSPTPSPNGSNFNSPTPSPTGNNGKSPTPSPHGDNFNSPTPSPHGDNGKSPTPSPNGSNFNSPTPSPHGDNGKSPTPSPNGSNFNSPTPSPTGDNGKSPTPSPNGSNFNSPTPSPHGDNGKSPTPSPTTCVSGWSKWINNDAPDTGEGDHETMSTAEKMAFCPGGKIIDIECATTGDMPYASTGEIATCYPDTGFTCNTMDNFDVPCQDYKIRYMCKCAVPTKPAGNDGFSTNSPTPQTGATPTPSPSSNGADTPTPSPSSVSGGVPTPSPTGVTVDTPTPHPTKCLTRWSAWLNRDKPENNNGDYEKMTPEEIQKFCPGGTITKVECETAGGIPFYSTGAIQVCTKEKGLMCNNADNFPVGCQDYKIKYYCVCNANPTPSPSAPGSVTPGLTPTASVVTPQNKIPEDCKVPMGMQNQAIRKEMITASSHRGVSSGPEQARLNGPNAWIAGVDNKNQYIQVDFLQPTYITGVTTQGRPSVPSYVTSYFVLFSNDGVNWNTYMENGHKKQFNGNFDSVTPVTHYFTAPLKARYIRINPQSFYGKVAMRFEIQGCFMPYPTTVTPTPAPTPSPTTPIKTPSKPPTTINIEKCTQWDSWVNLHSPTPTGNGDSEPIDEVKKHSPLCPNPTKIECLTATGQSADDLGQIITCNLWQGLECDNMNQFDPTGCMDYKVRLACLKQIPECVPVRTTDELGNKHTTKISTGPTSTILVVPKCYEDMDTSNCPASCPTGLYCDGQKCVKKSECTCKIEGKIVRPGDITQGSQCSTCQCFNGENKCLPKSCPTCQPGETKYVNVTSCQCSCKTCADNEFRCGNTRCIPKASRCDGVIDCDTDEVGCVVIPPFTPPVTPTPSPTTGTGNVPKLSPGPNNMKTPTPSPTLPDNGTPCVNGWSKWVDENNPNTYALGDKEKSATEYQKANHFCTKGTINKVECWNTDIDAPHYSSGEVHKCTPQEGLVCANADNFPAPCTNYKIRYNCVCNPEPSTTTGTMQHKHITPQLDGGGGDKSTSHTPPAKGPDGTGPPHTRYHEVNTTPYTCVAGWSKWVNENHPATYSLGDKEKSATEYQTANHFCVGGQIKRVECWDVDIDAAHYSSGESMKCTPKDGVSCMNADNFPAPCSDYKIRYLCECAPVTTASRKPITTASPTPKVTPTPGCDMSKCQPMVKPLLKEGEELIVVKTTDGCCDKYTVVCKPEKCTTQPPTCTTPRIVQQTNTGECCPQYKCECPTPCPTMSPPVCKPGSQYTVIDTDCNCQAYACTKNITGTMPPVVTIDHVCKYSMTNGHEVIKHPGDIWQDGLCKACQCIKRTDGTTVTSCQTQTCPPCQMGEVREDLPGECCGRCKPTGCVVNGTVYSAGQKMPTTRQCYTKTCIYVPDFQQFGTQDTYTVCPHKEDLPACAGNKTLYDSTGCCATCRLIKEAASQCSTCQPRLMFREPTRSVGFFIVTNPNGVSCQNKAPVQDLMECSGYCSSAAQYTAIMQGFSNKCNCCQPTSTTSKTVQLTCTDGTTIDKTYSVPNTCGCSACTAGH